MKTAHAITAAAIVLALAAAGCRTEPKQPAPTGPGAEPPPPGATEPAEKKTGPTAAEKLGLPDAPPELPPEFTGTAEPPGPDHVATGPGDRQLLANLFLAFSTEPQTFVSAVQAVPSERRQRLAAFMKCAAPRLLAAGQERPVGPPVDLRLPEEARQLIGFTGSEKRAKSLFLRQLAGEFLVVGRAISLVDKGDLAPVEKLIQRQKTNIEMLKFSAPPAKQATWRQSVEQAFPPLFASILPAC